MTTMHAAIRLGIIAALVAACGRPGGPSTSNSRAQTVAQTVAPSALLASVAAPRGYANVSLTSEPVRSQIADLVSALSEDGAASLAACGVELSRLGNARVVIGEPLQIAGELDGIDLKAVQCLFGKRALGELTGAGVIIRDRNAASGTPAGIAVEYHVDRSNAVTASEFAGQLAARCATDDCAAFRLGPSARPLWIQIRLGTPVHLELSGPALGGGAARFAAAIAQLKNTVPALEPMVVREHQGALLIDASLETTAMPLALRTHVIESFRIPSSSMVPTLMPGDLLFLSKGAFIGELVPGDLLAYESGQHTYFKRYMAGPGQTIRVTGQTVAIDGKPLDSQVVDPDFEYIDHDDNTGEDYTVSGALVREQLGGRSYLTLHAGAPRADGSWTVPRDRLFFLGDHRNNSNDSRYNELTPSAQVVGRPLAVWLAWRHGAPDWNRMGVPLE